MGDDLGAARATAEDAVSRISWPGMPYRTDIAGARRFGAFPGVKSAVSARIPPRNAPSRSAHRTAAAVADFAQAGAVARRTL